jgi:hypothetical protein
MDQESQDKVVTRNWDPRNIQHSKNQATQVGSWKTIVIQPLPGAMAVLSALYISPEKATEFRSSLDQWPYVVYLFFAILAYSYIHPQSKSDFNY